MQAHCVKLAVANRKDNTLTVLRNQDGETLLRGQLPILVADNGDRSTATR